MIKWVIFMKDTIKFIDLFSGMGGIRKGFELACNDLGLSSECVLHLKLSKLH